MIGFFKSYKMSLSLKNLQSNQQILLEKENPLIIGRNNVLGCFDKKVSRNHGRITCRENGEINLVALHSNPCFFMKKGVPPIRQLNKDEEETLNEGDCLGLLPNSFWFQISSINVEVKKEQETSSESCGDSETAKLENVKESNVNTNETENVKISTNASSDYSKRIGSPDFEKTRRLPLSAYDIDEIKESDKCSNTRDGDTNSKILKLNYTDYDIPQFDLKNKSIRKEDNKGREEPSTSKICSDTLDNCNEAKGVTNITKDKETKQGKPVKRPFCQYGHNCFRKNPQHKIEFCHLGDSDYVAYEDRPICQYGAACRRKNKRHRVEFRHVPAAPSNSSSDSPSGEERPPCFHGSRCFNQNLQHRKVFYHPPKGYNCLFMFEDSSSCSSEDFDNFCDVEIYEDYLAKEYDSDFASSPLPRKRRRKQVKRSSNYEDDVVDEKEEDEYDVEDPFANDASSDEYVPSDSDSKDESQEMY